MRGVLRVYSLHQNAYLKGKVEVGEIVMAVYKAMMFLDVEHEKLHEELNRLG